ncbi:MAG: nucleoside triphosphate pyrophosphohydrolase [Magnetococcales bacterium]|nr:nucleoside triphosphate pyrophosphohydrolase [Magnetococcales bacterium]MBF0438484.1 nucleoside triphosphate pyrophosphohydrolase [Magnetococcales bacterium]
MEELEALMARLRGPDGCPWDREQTPLSLLPYTIEEAYEVAEAVETRNPVAWRDELGDLLFHVVFHSRIAQEQGEFSLADVVAGVVEKMTRRHPHVFDPNGERLAEAALVLGRWEEIKRQEKGESGGQVSVFDDINSRLPALLWAAKVQRKMAQVGFDWKEPSGVIDKVHEELAELQQAADTDAREEELGDLLFTLVNLARHLQINPESALRRATRKFQDRFRFMEQRLHADNRTPHEADLEELEALWQESKRAI